MLLPHFTINKSKAWRDIVAELGLDTRRFALRVCSQSHCNACWSYKLYSCWCGPVNPRALDGSRRGLFHHLPSWCGLFTTRLGLQCRVGRRASEVPDGEAPAHSVWVQKQGPALGECIWAEEISAFLSQSQGFKSPFCYL